VEYQLAGGGTWTVFSDGTSTSTSAVVTGLTNGTGYVFRVAAVNGVGQGSYSSTSGSVTPIPTPPPDPSSFTATTNHSTQITLNWTSGGGTTDKFQVAYQTGSTAPATCSDGTVVSYSTIGSSTSSPITVSAVTDYAFRVCARDTYGQFSSGVTTTATTGWYQEAYIKAPNAQAADYFGYGVSISGDIMVVGSMFEDSNQTTVSNGTTASTNNTNTDSGAAYVFKRTGSAWSHEAYLKAPNSDLNDSFGYSVSVSGDTIVVGNDGEDSNQTTVTNGTNASTDNSASASGAAYVFKRNGSAWSQEAYLKAPNSEAYDNFGYSVSVSGDTIVVAALLDDSNQTTITNGTISSTDNSASSSGAAYVFKRSNSTWQNEAYLKAPNSEAIDYFGFSLSVSGDTIVVGASNEDSSQTTVTNGTTASTDNSASGSGAAYVFKRNGRTWTHEAYLKASNNEGGDSFGAGVSVSGDTIVVGNEGEDSNQTTVTNGTNASTDNSASSSGSAYVFKRAGGSWTQEAYLKAPNADSADYFGFTVAISGDTIVAGAGGEDSNQTTITNGASASVDKSANYSGAAYVFKRTAANWVSEAYLKAPNTEANDWFGYSVAISGDTIVVGSYAEASNQTTITNGTTASADNSAADSGAVYVFRRAATTGLTPSITSVSPSTFSVAGGGMVSVFGSGFQSGATVTVGGATCTNPIWQGYNEVLCTLPSGASGSATVVVTNPGGANGSSSSAFSYETVTVDNPTSFTATANSGTQITLSWVSGGASNATYQVAYQTGASAPASCSDGTVIPHTTVQSSTSIAVTSLSSSTQYSFRLCGRDLSANLSSGVTTSATTTSPPPASCASNNCFDDATAKSLGVAIGPGGATIEYLKANSSCSGGSCFYLWKEQGGSRILAASGNAADGWQKKLNRSGIGFSEDDLTDAAVIKSIEGRVCPTHVFLSHDNMTATGRCLYYDGGTAAQRLDAAGVSGTEGEDWLQNWNRANTGRGTGSSYYEGNIKTCADKGMRLPTMYETTMTAPASTNLPTGDSITPTFATTNGVPSSGWTWTASAYTNVPSAPYLPDPFWVWSGTSSSGHFSYSYSQSVRCVLP